MQRQTYIQEDGVAMGSPLGPLLVKIFMTTLEEAVLPTIKKTWATGNGMTITHMCIMIPQKKKSMYKRN